MTQPELHLPPREAHLWCVTPAEASDPALLDNYRSLLTPEERERYQRYHFEKDRLLFLLTRALVRTTLSRYGSLSPTQWEFEANSHGKPQLVSPCPHLTDVSFNLTNTQGLVGLLLARTETCGVDTEYLNRPVRFLSLADRFFSPLEVQHLHAQPPHQQAHRFLTYWTLKESFIKAEGQGLSIPLDSFSIELDGNKPRVKFHSHPGTSTHWQLEERRLRGDHLLGVTLHRPAAPDYTLRTRFTVPSHPERDVDAEAP